MTDATFPRPILLFDGTCGLCDGTVKWLLRHDRDGRLHYAPLQSPVGQAALRAVGLEGDLSSVVLIDDAGAHQRSDAVWRVSRLLPWPWRAGAALRLVPRFVREPAYKLVAGNRYRVFGRTDACLFVGALPVDQQKRILA